ncbi:hypothetical protein LTR97_011984 [Elasticomyces elasticus]|uniref:Transcription factor domain-containing protein n=1 Tax=Elasticomyces elasticus TaxID=574655 RepID=A0AAN7ZZH1_9PEZI|nr:hypothetical protein LTR97_011984 [Elasticomyces elasticus]
MAPPEAARTSRLEPQFLASWVTDDGPHTMLPTRQHGAPPTAGIRKPRKSRGRGLRTTTGCKGRRECIYGIPLDGDESSSDERNNVRASVPLVAALPTTTSVLQPTSDDQTQAPYATVAQQWPVTPHSEHLVNVTSPQSTYSASTAYGTEVAPLRWFGLLAGDIDSNVDLQVPSSDDHMWRPSYQQQHDGGHTRLVDSAAGTFGELIGHQNSSKLLQMPAILSADPSGDGVGVDERLFWQASEPVRLEEDEYDMLQHFVISLSQWIDLFDPMKHFSTFVPHLAMRNQGLMKAILALSARHLSIKPPSNGEVNVSRTAAVQYYYETLQYLQSAMRFTTYKNSLELLATTLVWAAFRERRRCFSFFRPTRSYESMDPWDLASKVVYILAQSVNYSSEEEKQQGERDLAGRILRANTLLDLLAEWRDNISVHFQPLPMATLADRAFKPVWIHPPAFGVSLQLYSMARLLLLIHQPAAGGYLEYGEITGKGDPRFEHELTFGQDITACIDEIGSVAMNVLDDASRLMSTQCLFAAGLYCTDNVKRECIAELITEHATHTGWPSNVDLAEELRLEWSRQERPG